MTTKLTEVKNTETSADVYCPICTHTVNGVVIKAARRIYVKPGQKCSHCHSSLDAGYVFSLTRAA